MLMLGTFSTRISSRSRATVARKFSSLEDYRGLEGREVHARTHKLLGYVSRPWTPFCFARLKREWLPDPADAFNNGAALF